MACFLVPAAEALVVTVVEKKEKKKEGNIKTSQSNEVAIENEKLNISWSRKLKWLRSMLSGGSVLLLFEHIWHGEVTPWFPFLTNMATEKDALEMLHEIATIGVSMAMLTTAIWLGMCKVADVIVRRPDENVKGVIE